MNQSSPRRARRVVAVIAGLAAASLLLGGCLYSLIPESPPVATASPTPDTEGVSAELLPFYGQDLTWEACNDTFQCTTVRAPLDWADPSAGEIELALIRSRAEGGEAVGSLLVNPGGPGVSGVALIRDSLEFAVGDPVRAAYDVVGFDPRGVADSTAVSCLDDAGLDEYFYGLAENPRDSDAWTEELTAANRAFAEGCDENSDGILPFITTENSARDLDLLRAVLGDRELNFLGYSYGSFLGTTYAKLYPERVGRLVLDGALDPSMSLREIGVTQTIGFESALRAYMASCVTLDDCPFRGTVDEAMADLAVLLASTERDPLRGSDGRMLGADTLITAINAALYSPESWEFLTIALTDVLAGDPEVAFLLSDFYLDREEGVYVSNKMEAFRAYNCMDYPREVSPEQEAEYRARLESEAPTIAPYSTGPAPCDVWVYPPTGIRERITAEGAAPIVVVGTTNDPATPYEWAVSLADQLSSGVLVTRVGEGHTGYNKGNECVDAAVEAYLVDGTVPEDGLRCE